MLDTLAERGRRKNKGANVLGGQDGKVPRPLTKIRRVHCARSPAASKRAGAGDSRLQKRVDHILTRQVFASGITQDYQLARAAQRVLLQARTASTPSPNPSPAMMENIWSSASNTRGKTAV